MDIALSTKKILIIEDDEHIAQIIANRLSTYGHHCEMAHDGSVALSKLCQQRYDLVSIDIMLPRIDGLELCKFIHENYPKTLIVIISALDTDEKKTIAYQSGSDDFITKPFNGKELLFKINALFRRQSIQENPKADMLNGSFMIDDEAKKVMIAGRTVLFTPSEYHIFHALIQAKKTVFSRDNLAEILWEHGCDLVDHRVVDSHIYHIRKKLSDIDNTYKNIIKTVHGFGYKINDI